MSDRGGTGKPLLQKSLFRKRFPGAGVTSRKERARRYRRSNRPHGKMRTHHIPTFDPDSAFRQFDSDKMITASDLDGTWQFNRSGDPSGIAFLHFSDTRAFDFICDGEVRQPLSLWYVLEEPDQIRFRTRPEDEGWTCQITLEGDSLIISGDSQRTVCTRPRAEDIPAWFHQGLEQCMGAL
jgi:hypothetical protein